jgi:hypothetical protein
MNTSRTIQISWKVSLIFLGMFLNLTPRTVNAQPAQLMVSGNQIVTASGGCTVRFKGVNIDSLEYNSVGDGPSGDILTAVQAAVTGWGANIIRLPLCQDRWFGVSNTNNKTAAYYQSLVQGIVQYCSTNNVYIILDLHWSGTYSGTAPTTPQANTNGWGTATAQQVMPDWNSVTFWSSVASTSWVQNNPAVLLDLYNEPHPDASLGFPNDWGVWLSGGSTSNTPSQTPGMQYLLNTIRGVGANNMVIAGGLQFCQDLSDINVYSLTDTASGYGVVYGAHIYGNTTGDTNTKWNNQIATYTTKHPVFVGEFGPSTSCNTDDTTFDSNFFPWLNGSNVNSYVFPGGTGWSYHPSSCPNMLNSDWVTPTAWGTVVKNWLATPVPTCPSGPANTATPTNTKTNTPTFTYTKTATPSFTPTYSFTATNTKTNTNTFTVTNTPQPPTDTPTATWTNTFTNTFTSTNTMPAGTNTNTPVNTDTPTYTSTPDPTDTPGSGSTNTFTVTPDPTDTPASGSTNTPSFTTTPDPTDTPGSGSTNTPTATPVTAQVSQGPAAPPSSVSDLSGSAGVTVAEPKINNPSSGSFTMTSLIVTESGSPTSDITSLVLTKNGTTLAVASFAGSTATFNFSDVVPINGSAIYDITANFSSTAVGTYQFSVLNAVATNGQSVNFNGFLLPGAQVTVSQATPTPTLSPTFTVTLTTTPTFTPSSTPTTIPITASFPNPTNGRPVEVDIDTPSNALIKWDVFTAAFRKIRGDARNYSAGIVRVIWDLRDSKAYPVSDGVYYLRVQVDNSMGRKVTINKVLVIR